MHTGSSMRAVGQEWLCATTSRADARPIRRIRFSHSFRQRNCGLERDLPHVELCCRSLYLSMPREKLSGPRGELVRNFQLLTAAEGSCHASPISVTRRCVRPQCLGRQRLGSDCRAAALWLATNARQRRPAAEQLRAEQAGRHEQQDHQARAAVRQFSCAR